MPTRVVLEQDAQTSSRPDSGFVAPTTLTKSWNEEGNRVSSQRMCARAHRSAHDSRNPNGVRSHDTPATENGAAGVAAAAAASAEVSPPPRRGAWSAPGRRAPRPPW